MPDRWMLRGTNYANCNCLQGCPCQFGAPTSHGHCEAVGANHIEEGYFNDVRLDGLDFAMLVYWPGEIAEGNGRCQFIIDERATPEQREALLKILRGESTAPGATHFYVFASTMSEFLDPIFAPIELSLDVEARRARLRVADLVESEGMPIPNPFGEGEFRAGIDLPDGFEYTHAEVGLGSTRSQAGIALDLEASHSHFSQLHMNQDGVVRS